MTIDITHYSHPVMGNARNHSWAVRFDYHDGFVGITQQGERVLLTPHQMRELEAFIEQCREKDVEYLREVNTTIDKPRRARRTR